MWGRILGRSSVGELGGSVTETGMEWCPCGRLAVNDEGAKMNWGWIKVEG